MFSHVWTAIVQAGWGLGHLGFFLALVFEVPDPCRPSWIIAVPERIQVQRSLERSRLYLLSLKPPEPEVIIRKNAEQVPEFEQDYRREIMRSKIVSFGQ